MSHTTEQLRQWCQGTWLIESDPAYLVEELVIDTRKIGHPETALFIALKSQRRDGHAFVRDAYEKGIRNFLLQDPTAGIGLEAANIILVKDTLSALQGIVARHRRRFGIPVVGITGSNGKTVVKEWLYQLLGERFNIVRSPKSYNSQIGVPLSVWQMEPEHELALFEAGISQPGEMELLEKIIQPTIGIFTNIGEAHSEGFLNRRQKINEKLILFRHARQLVYCSDHHEVHECVLAFHQQVKGEQQLSLFSWSQKHDADLRITGIVSESGKTQISSLYQGQTMTIELPFTDPASIENAIHCWCVMLLLDCADDAVAERMKHLQPIAMRLELRKGINGCTLINDTYNSDLTSLLIALDYLEQQKQHQSRTVILSDMYQVGRPDSELYEEVAALIARKKISRFIGVGPAISRSRDMFKKNRKLRSAFFQSTEELLKNLHRISFEKEAVLLKGARSFAFEKLSMLLEEEVHQTVLSIDLSALTHNLNVFRSYMGKGVKTMAMVKAFSYGSGSYEIAHMLQYSGVDYLAVAYTDEGIALRKGGISMPIMVMSPDAVSFDRMIAWKLEPEIFNLRSLHAFLVMARTLEVQDYPIHIKLDTGMHRLGFPEQELEELIAVLRDHTSVRVASIFSHLAASEDPSLDFFTEEQGERFRRMSAYVKEALGISPILHLCNSAGISRHRHLHFDMVRLGLGLYGIDGGGVLDKDLRHISSLRTTIAQIKDVPVGETVSYGRKGVAETPMRIATISIGYADGYPRALGQRKAHVLIHGQPAPVVGVVCMDMCMVDITHIPEAKEGDEVLVFGPGLPVTQLAQWAGTIAYEIMTGISQRVKRVYVNEG